MAVRFIFKKEKKEIIEQLEYYGITDLPYLLISTGKEKIRAYSGGLSTDELIEIDKDISIEIIGLYLLHNYDNNLRLSVDAISLLKDKITKNIIDLNEQQAKEFFLGQDIILNEQDKEKFKDESKGFKIARYNKDLIGTVKLSTDRITNYLPKERRAKK